MTDFEVFIAENNITPENTPGSEHRLLRKAFLAGMRSQSERIKRILNKNKSLQMNLEDCLEKVEYMNLMFAAMEEEQEK